MNDLDGVISIMREVNWWTASYISFRR